MSDQLRVLRDKIARALGAGLADHERTVFAGRQLAEAQAEAIADAVLAVLDLDKVRAEAWDEGHESAAMRVPGGVWHDVAAPHPGNPYRKAEQ